MDRIEKKNILPITVQEVESHRKSFFVKKMNFSVFVKSYGASSDYFERFYRPISKIINFDE